MALRSVSGQDIDLSWSLWLVLRALSPLVWVGVWVSWQSIVREYPIGRASDLHLSRLATGHLFRMKYLPLVACLFLVIVLSQWIVDAANPWMWSSKWTVPFVTYIHPRYFLASILVRHLSTMVLLPIGTPLITFSVMILFPRSGRQFLCLVVSGLLACLVYHGSYYIGLGFWAFVLRPAAGMFLPPDFLIQLSHTISTLPVLLGVGLWVGPRFSRLFELAAE